MITVFYDGSCGLCHRAVQFLLARDSRGARFRYAALQGATAARLLGDVDALPDSMVVQCVDGTQLTQGRAAVHLGRALGGGWWLLATIGDCSDRRARLALRPRRTTTPSVVRTQDGALPHPATGKRPLLGLRLSPFR